MKLQDAEIVIWNGGAGLLDWYWEFVVNGKVVGKGVRTSEDDARTIAGWLGSELQGPDGAIGFRYATPEEISEGEAAARMNREMERERRSRGLGVINPRKSKDLMDLMYE